MYWVIPALKALARAANEWQPALDVYEMGICAALTGVFASDFASEPCLASEMLKTHGLLGEAPPRIVVLGNLFVGAALDQCLAGGSWTADPYDVDWNTAVVLPTPNAVKLCSSPGMVGTEALLKQAELVLRATYVRGLDDLLRIARSTKYFDVQADPFRAAVERVQAHANQAFGYSRKLVDAKGKVVGAWTSSRYYMIRRALMDWGYTEVQLCEVLTTVAANDYMRKGGWIDVTNVFAKPTSIDNWIERGRSKTFSYQGAQEGTAF